MSRTTEELRAAADQRLSALDRARREIGAIRERGESDGGEVAAVVDGAGALVDLHLVPGTTAMPADVLGGLIVMAAARAAALAAQRMRTVRALAEGDAIAHAWDRLHDPEAMRAPIPSASDGTPCTPSAEVDIYSFDPAMLRSDR